MELQEYMADQRWVRREARRLLPKTDGMYLYIWTKAGTLPAAKDSRWGQKHGRRKGDAPGMGLVK